MLLPREQDSWNCAYALGAFALDSLTEAPTGQMDINRLHSEMARSLKKDLSINQVVIALSWLYLINKVEITASGEIRRCT
jgi:hypothetical protein